MSHFHFYIFGKKWNILAHILFIFTLLFSCVNSKSQQTPTEFGPPVPQPGLKGVLLLST